MSAPFCLLPKHADELAKRFESGEFSLAKLIALGSEGRRAAFAETVGEANAAHVNANVEAKLMLKGQQTGLENYVKGLKGLKPDVARDLLARVSRMDKVLEPADANAFMADLAARRLGFRATMEQAGKIAELAKATQDAKAAMASGGDRMAYGRAKYDFGEYVSDLKNDIKKPLTIGGVASDAAGLSKALNAWGDDSALLRQGWNTFWSDNPIWRKNALQSFKDMWDTFGGKHVMREVSADILSRPNAVNGRYRRAKLAIGNVEEAFPTSLPEKVPVLGKVYKATENAFTAFQYRTRADVFDKMVDIAERTNAQPASWWNRHADLEGKAGLESIGKVVNSLTARGDLGRAEPIADVVNNVFFSGRKIAGDFDVLTLHARDQDLSGFARKQAAINLLKIVSGTGAVLAIANALQPGSTTPDALVSDFGKVKIGDTRFETTGGKSAMIILAARMAALAADRGMSMVGKKGPVDTKAFANSDLVENFFTGKLSPAARVAHDLWTQQTFDRTKPTLLGEAASLVTPMSASTVTELAKAENGANVLLGAIMDALGVGVNTYTPKPKKYTR